MHQDAVAAAMSNPAFYPVSPTQVEVIQTHISWIFIAGDNVFKVKKAVDFGFLNFTTLEKRKFYCEEEVRLNRRLAPQVYLGVVEISCDQDGNVVFGPGDSVLEYAVHMKKIPAEKMLKTLLRSPAFDGKQLTAVAGKLVRFHREAETGGIIDEAGNIEKNPFQPRRKFYPDRTLYWHYPVGTLPCIYSFLGAPISIRPRNAVPETRRRSSDSKLPR